MNFGPKRGHVLFIFENFIKDFGLLIVALIVGMIQGDMAILRENIPVLIIVIIGPVGRIMQYLFTYYTIDDEKLTVKSGVLSKKTMEIPISTITTVDFSQNIIHQIFGVYSLNIDNASNVSEQKTKIKMTFSKADAEEVRNLLVRGRKGIDGLNLAATEDIKKGPDLGKLHNIKATDLLFMGAIKSKGAFFIQLFAVVSALSTYVVSTEKVAEFAVEHFSGGINIVNVLLIIAPVVIVLGVIGGAVGALIKYYDFRILDNGEAIKIEYGLITKKNYTIPKKKISGFSYQQSLVMRLMGTGTLQLFAIGYGATGEDEESREDPIIFPLIKADRIRSTMADILPEMKRESEYDKPKKGSLHYFFYSFGFIFSLILLGGSIYCAMSYEFCENLWIVGILILVYSIISCILQYRNSGIYGNEQNISLSYGGYKKTTVFVKTANVESISESASYFRHKKGITNVTISYIAPLIDANKEAKSVSIKAFEDIRSKLIY